MNPIGIPTCEPCYNTSWTLTVITRGKVGHFVVYRAIMSVLSSKVRAHVHLVTHTSSIMLRVTSFLTLEHQISSEFLT